MSDHGDSAAIRSYADKLRSAGRRLQAISDDADAWVYFCTADWKGQFKDDLLRLWNENFTANDTLNAQAWADQRESFIKAHPNRARLYDANFDPGKTAFRTLIDACNSFAAWLDDYATAIDKADQADETKFWVDVGIGVVVLVATVATAGLAAPETLAGGIALGAAIGGVTSVVMDASNQTIDNMILKGDSFGQALGDLNVQELTAAFGVGAIVGGFTVILGTGLNSVLTSGVSKIFGQAAINTFSRIGIAGLSFGTASALTDVAIQEVLTGKVDWGQVALAGGMGMVGGAAGAATMEVTGPEGTFTASVRPDGLLTVRNGDNDYVGTGSISPDGTQIVVQPPKGDPFTISLNGKVQVSDALSGFKIEDGQLTQLWSAGDGRTQLTVLTGRDSVPTELIDPATGKLVVREGWTISQTLPDGAVTISSPDGAVQVRGLVVAEQVGSGAPTGPQAMTLLPDGEVVPAGPSTASGPGVQGVRVGSWVSFGTTDATSGGTDPVAELLARFPGSGGSDGPSAPGIDAAPPAGPGDGGAGPGSALDLPGPKGWEPPGWNVQPDPGGSVVIGGKTYTDFPSAPAAQGGAGPEAGGSSATTLSGRPSGLRLSPQEGSGPATQTAVSQGVDVALADPPGSTASSAGVESVERLPIDPVADLPGSPSSAAPGPTAPSGGWSAAPAVVAGLAPGWAASWGMPAPAGLGPAPAPSPPRVPEVPGPLTSLPKPPPELTVSPQPEVPGPVGPRPTPPVTSVPGPTSIEVPPPGAPTPSAPLAPARPPLPGPSPTPDPTQVPPASRPGTLPPGQRPRVDPDVPTLPRPPRPGVEVPRPGTTDGPQPVPEVPSPAADEVPPLPRQEAVPPAMTEVLPPVGREVTSPQSWLPRPPIEVPPLNAGGPRPAGAPRPPAASTGPSLEGPEDDGGGKAEGEPDRGRATGSNLGFVPDGDEVSQPRSASNRGAENPEPEPAAAAAPAPPQGTSAWSPGPAETTLAGREVARVEPLPDWPEERGVFLVTFADGSRAVWKVRPGPQMVHNLAFFRTSEMLGFDLVPVTALRSLPEQGEGSLQEWVEGSPIQWPITGYSELDQQMGAVLDYIAAQTDRHNLNARVRPDGRLAFTDNKASFSKWRGLATSSDFVKAWRNRPLHPEVVEKVRGVSPEDYRAMLLGTGLEAVEADNAVARLQEIQARGMITGEADAGAPPAVARPVPAPSGPDARGGPAAAPGGGGSTEGGDHIHLLKPPPGRTRPLGPNVTRPLTRERLPEFGPNLLPPGDPDLLRPHPHLPYLDQPKPVSVPGVDPADVLDEGSPGFWRLADAIRRLSRETNLEIAVVELEAGGFAIVAGGKYGMEAEAALGIERWWMHTHPHWMRADGPSLGDLRILARSQGQRYAYLVEPGREVYRYEVPDWMREAFKWQPAPSPEADRSLRHALQFLQQWDRWTKPEDGGWTPVERLGASLEDGGRELQHAVQALRQAVVEGAERVGDLGRTAEDLAAGLAGLIERADGAVATLRAIQSNLGGQLHELETLVAPAGLDSGLRLRVEEVVASRAAEELARDVDHADVVLTTAAAELQQLGFALPEPASPGPVVLGGPAGLGNGGLPSQMAGDGPPATGGEWPSAQGLVDEGEPRNQALREWLAVARVLLRRFRRGHGAARRDPQAYLLEYLERIRSTRSPSEPPPRPSVPEPAVLKSAPDDPRPPSSYELGLLRSWYRAEAEARLRAFHAEERTWFLGLEHRDAGRAQWWEHRWHELLELQRREWEEVLGPTPPSTPHFVGVVHERFSEPIENARGEVIGGLEGEARFLVIRHLARDGTNLVTELLLPISLVPDPGVSSIAVEQVRARIVRAVDHVFNLPHHRLPDGSLLRVTPRTTPLGSPQLYNQVQLHSGSGRSYQAEWYLDGVLNASGPYNWAELIAHELGHQMGLIDEYYELHNPGRRTSARLTPRSPGVHYDDSLWGMVCSWRRGVLPRHLDRIWERVQRARPAAGALLPDGSLPDPHPYTVLQGMMVTYGRALSGEMSLSPPELAYGQRLIDQALTNLHVLHVQLRDGGRVPGTAPGSILEDLLSAGRMRLQLRDLEIQTRTTVLMHHLAAWDQGSVELERARATLDGRWQALREARQAVRATAPGGSLDEIGRMIRTARERADQLAETVGLIEALVRDLSSVRAAIGAELEALRGLAARQVLISALDARALDALARDLGVARPVTRPGSPASELEALAGPRDLDRELQERAQRVVQDGLIPAATSLLDQARDELRAADAIVQEVLPGERVVAADPLVLIRDATEVGKRLLEAGFVPDPLAMSRRQFLTALAQLERAIRDNLRPAEAAALARIERQAKLTAWSWGLTRAITDPMVGEPTQQVRQAASEDLQRWLQEQAEEIAALVNHPTLSPRGRARAIGQVVDRVARRTAGTVLAYPLGGIDLKSVRRAVKGLRSKAVPGVLVMDGDGNLSVGGRPWGTFRQLLEDLVVANRCSFSHGLDVEYLVSIAPRRVDGASQVHVISRPRAHLVPWADVPSHRLAALPSDVPGRFIVDVRFGQGSLGAELVPLEERLDSVVVQVRERRLALDAQLRANGWPALAEVVPHGWPHAIVVFGDGLEAMEAIFGTPETGGGVRRAILSCVPAHYDQERYAALARQLKLVMAPGGRIDVQWDLSPEGGYRGTSRGHIQGDALRDALLQEGADIAYRLEPVPSSPWVRRAVIEFQAHRSPRDRRPNDDLPSFPGLVAGLGLDEQGVASSPTRAGLARSPGPVPEPPVQGPPASHGALRVTPLALGGAGGRLRPGAACGPCPWPRPQPGRRVPVPSIGRRTKVDLPQSPISLQLPREPSRSSGLGSTRNGRSCWPGSSGS